VTPLTTGRLVLLLAAIALFIYSMRVGIEWPRLVAIGLLVSAVLIGLYERWRKRQG
jgi:hypothetical protein